MPDASGAQAGKGGPALSGNGPSWMGSLPQGLMLCMQSCHPCCAHILLSCTAPSSSTAWALLQGLQAVLAVAPSNLSLQQVNDPLLAICLG